MLIGPIIKTYPHCEIDPLAIQNYRSLEQYTNGVLTHIVRSLAVLPARRLRKINLTVTVANTHTVPYSLMKKYIREKAMQCFMVVVAARFFLRNQGL